MLKLAILHSAMSGQVKEHDKMGNMEVVWVDTDMRRLQFRLPGLKPDAIAIDLESLGDDPLKQLADLRERSGNATILVIYAFAKWSLIEKIRVQGYRTAKSPVSMRVLNANLLDLIVKSLSKGASRDITDFKPKRYTKLQLGKLQEIQSAVDCECPNHVAELVLSLGMFEDYSAKCRNKDDADAAIHKMLYEETARARAIMEEALTKLCRHEQIDVDRIGSDVPPRTGTTGLAGAR